MVLLYLSAFLRADLYSVGISSSFAACSLFDAADGAVVDAGAAADGAAVDGTAVDAACAELLPPVFLPPPAMEPMIARTATTPQAIKTIFMHPPFFLGAAAWPVPFWGCAGASPRASAAICCDCVCGAGVPHSGQNLPVNSLPHFAHFICIPPIRLLEAAYGRSAHGIR